MNQVTWHILARLHRAHLHPSFGKATKERISPDPLGFAGPFIPSSLDRPDTPLRTERIGGLTFRSTGWTAQTTNAWSDFSDQARISEVTQDSDFRTEIGSRKNTRFPSLPLCVRRTLGETYLIALTIMAHPTKSPAAQFHVECSPEAKSRFAVLHEAFGFKTKAATFEAILYAASLKDKIDPQILLRLEAKLDRLLEHFDDVL
jgi:hypothetical protein